MSSSVRREENRRLTLFDTNGRVDYWGSNRSKPILRYILVSQLLDIIMRDGYLIYLFVSLSLLSLCVKVVKVVFFSLWKFVKSMIESKSTCSMTGKRKDII